jgi:CO/xanthine dehydrogenase FAD-binding subunit
MPQLFQPTTFDEAVKLLAQYSPNARVVNGGTDLPHEIEHGIRVPQILIDISHVAGLNYIREDGDYIRLGPSVTHGQAIVSDLLRARAFPLVRACSMFADPDARAYGTIVGNVASALPANLAIAALWAMGAEVKLKSVRGERVVSFADFFKGIRQTTLEPDELLSEIAFSKMSPKDKGTFLATGWSRDETQAGMTCAVVLEFEEDEISNAWITLGGIAPTVVNAIDAEQSLVGQWLSDAAIDEAAELAVNAVLMNPDKMDTVRELVARAFREIRDMPGS